MGSAFPIEGHIREAAFAGVASMPPDVSIGDDYSISGVLENAIDHASRANFHRPTRRLAPGLPMKADVARLKRRARRLQELKLRRRRGSAEYGVSMWEASEPGDNLQMTLGIFDVAVVGRPFA